MSDESTDPYSPPTANVQRTRRGGRSQLDFVGFGTRFLAMILDSIWLVVISFGLSYLLVGSWAFLEPEFVPTGGIMLVQNVLPAVLILGFWNMKAATPGKMLMGVKIVNYRTGEPASFGQLLGRYLGYILSGLVLCLGYLWVIWDKEKRGWHDKLSNTAVVRN